MLSSKFDSLNNLIRRVEIAKGINSNTSIKINISKMIIELVAFLLIILLRYTSDLLLINFLLLPILFNFQQRRVPNRMLTSGYKPENATTDNALGYKGND